MNYLVIALGNPGDKFAKTRHNAGWIIVDVAFPNLDWRKNSYANAAVAQLEDAGRTSFIQKIFGSSSGPRIQLCKPLTFMNESGFSAKYFVTKEKILPENIIVVYDDIDLPIGKMKISFGRGSGGHNGIKSIEEQLKTRHFIRIRIGISKMLESGELIKPNVLGNFEESEQEVLASLALRVKLAIETIIREGKEVAMTEFNSEDPHIEILKT